MHAGDVRPLQVLAAEFGFELVAKEQAQPQTLAAALLRMTKEVADVTRVVHDALEDGHVSQTEEALIQREICHARQSLDVLEASVKAA